MFKFDRTWSREEGGVCCLYVNNNLFIHKYEFSVYNTQADVKFYFNNLFVEIFLVRKKQNHREKE